ncbi:MAG: hypothetical protein JNM00_11205, partial [Flavobacteriales bacterium]|nr:hypothetical protein [Flavobacteriales bacterium]
CEGEEGVFSLANVTGMTYAWTAIPDGAFSTPGQYTTGASFTENSTISCSLSKNGCNGVAMFNVTIDPSGCTDPDASNYDPSAICDDGTCSTVPDCPGDFTNDGVVNTNDLLFFLGELGCSGTCIADFTNDGLVNTNDLLLFLGWFGTSC